MKRFDAAAANGEAGARDDARAGGSVPTPEGRPAMDGGGGVTRGFPLKSGGLPNFIRRSGVTISYSNAFIDLSVGKKCPDHSNFLSLQFP
ncbi:hypothetical protein [Burkholderia cepacia]|uniref:hypothetical protein n=1 Tax=Burkholderia cepacia TaxID=292 RepID=UPI001F34E813|nr:hypothetical protein [Burkholderia cepacia]MCE4126737.1 hypothetical protein [Burkholderia cepacia]